MHVIDARKDRITFSAAIVVSRFNEEITSGLLVGALARFKELEFAAEQLTVVWVPGAVEIPIMAKRLAKTKRYQAILALGAVIRGETSHYDYVCDQVSGGCQRVALDESVPVVFGVLTTENEEQARDRIGGKHGHKGRDVVDAAVELVSALRQVV